MKGRPPPHGGRRFRGAAAGLLSAALAMAGAGAGAEAGGSSPAPASTALAPCWLDGIEHAAWCGQVRRPLDPARPAGVQIDVHYAVLPAVARRKKPDPVFFFAGGPGQSAIDLAPFVSALTTRLANRRDVVLIDQRGTGRSAPLDCEADDPSLPLADQFDPAREKRRLAACLGRLQRLPYGDLRFFTTVIASADADAVRAALGAERIDLVGASYGTRVALDYLRQFGRHVRRSVLDGVAPADMGLPRAASADNQAALDAVFAACARDASCARRWPDLRGQWRRLLAGLPREVTVTHPSRGRPERFTLTRDALLGLVRGPLYVPALAAALPAAIGEAAAGRFDPLAGLAQALGGRRGLELATGMHYAVVCAEDVAPTAAPGVRPAAATGDGPGGTRGVAAVGGEDFGTAFESLYRDVCRDWPRGAVPADFATVPPSASAVLLLSGGADPATPPRHAERTARALGPLARAVVAPNAGHGLLGIGCARDLVFRFIDAETDAEAIALDTGCLSAVPRPGAWLPADGEATAR